MKARGFTLVELVVAMVISAILIGFVSLLVSSPIDAYIDQSERVELSHSAETTSRFLGQDLSRDVVPNSIRIRGDGLAIELLKVTAASFFVPNGSTPPPGSAAIELQLGVPGDTFRLFGQTGSNANFIVTGHRGSAGADAYAMADVIVSGFGLTPMPNGVVEVRLAGTDSLNDADSLHRVFWVSEPVTYICDMSERTLRRFSGYPINSNIASSSAAPQLVGGRNTLISENLNTCTFTCGSVGLGNVCQGSITFRGDAVRATSFGSETLRILEQYRVDNRS